MIYILYIVHTAMLKILNVELVDEDGFSIQAFEHPSILQIANTIN